MVAFLFTEEQNVNSFSENIIANAGTDDVTADEINSSVKKRKRGYVSNNFSNPHFYNFFHSLHFRCKFYVYSRLPLNPF